MTAPTLGYANPRVFFEDVFQYRSAGTLLVAAFLAVFGLGLGVLIFAGGSHRWASTPHLAWGFGWVAVFLLGAGYFAVLYLSGREDRIRITEDGIEYGRRAWPWDRVEWLGGVYEDDDATLVNVVVRTRAGDGLLDGLSRSLSPTPLTRGEFARLTREVESYLSHHCPRVKVERRPLPAPASSG